MLPIEKMRAMHEANLKHSDLDEAGRNESRIRFAQHLDAEKQRRIQIVVDAEKEAQSSGIVRAGAGTLGAAGLHFANTAALGGIPAVAGVVSDDSRAKLETALDASAQTNPIASMAGDIGAFVSPRTPAGMIANLGSRGLSAATRVRGLVEAAALKPFYVRAAAASLQNLTGSAGAIAATNATQINDKTLQQRLADTYHQTTSLSNLALSGGMGAWAAKWLRPADKEMAPIYEKIRQVTGKEIPSFIPGKSKDLAQEFDTALVTPGVADTAHRVKDRFIDGTRQMIREIGDRAGAAEGQTKRAANAVRRLSGTPRSFLNPKGTESILDVERTGAESAALLVDGANKLTFSGRRAFIKMVKESTKGRSRVDPRGEDMQGLLVDTARMMMKGPVDLNDMEALRQRYGTIGFVVAQTARGKKEAANVYNHFDTFLRQLSTPYADAIKAGEVLRRQAEAFAGVKASDLDGKTMARLWSGDNPIERFEILKRKTLPEDVAAAKGWLWMTLVRTSLNADGMLSGVKLNRNLGGEGMLSREVIDHVLPGTADELLQLSKIHDIARPVFAQNSKTAGRGLSVMSKLATGASVGTTIAAMFGNPFNLIGIALGAQGAKWVAQHALKGMVDGTMAEARSLLQQGVAPRAIGPTAVALQQAGGDTGIAETARRSAGAIGETAGTVANTVGRWMAPQENQQ